MFVQTKANVKQHEDILCIIKWLNSQTDIRKAYTPSLVNEHIECISIQQKRLLFKNNLKNLNLNFELEKQNNLKLSTTIVNCLHCFIRV